jgi:hypothetical protein
LLNETVLPYYSAKATGAPNHWPKYGSHSIIDPRLKGKKAIVIGGSAGIG